MLRALVATLAFLFATELSAADAMKLGEFLDSIDRTPISVTGRIKYDRSEDEFVFYDENRTFFGVSFDAGRSAREEVEEKCQKDRYFATFDELCSIEAEGTVEVRNGNFVISIEKVTSLTP